MKFRVLTSFAVAAFGLAAVATAPAHAEEEAAAIQVALNHAKVIKLSRPATTIIIGNPAIADATVEDSQTIVLTGQGFGNTNLVILDAAGSPIFDEKIAVMRDNDVLRIYRRASIETLACAPYCEGAYLTQAEIEANEARLEASRVAAITGN